MPGFNERNRTGETVLGEPDRPAEEHCLLVGAAATVLLLASVCPAHRHARLQAAVHGAGAGGRADADRAARCAGHSAPDQRRWKDGQRTRRQAGRGAHADCIPGAPHSGRMGFELFDKMSWGQTEFDEKVTYQRALEGELERTIETLGDVESARVHLVMPTDSVFLDQRTRRQRRR